MGLLSFVGIAFIGFAIAVFLAGVLYIIRDLGRTPARSAPSGAVGNGGVDVGAGDPFAGTNAGGMFPYAGGSTTGTPHVHHPSSHDPAPYAGPAEAVPSNSHHPTHDHVNQAHDLNHANHDHANHSHDAGGRGD